MQKYKIRRLFTDPEGNLLWVITFDLNEFTLDQSEIVRRQIVNKIIERYECEEEAFEVTGWSGSAWPQFGHGCLNVRLNVKREHVNKFFLKNRMWCN